MHLERKVKIYYYYSRTILYGWDNVIDDKKYYIRVLNIK